MALKVLMNALVLIFSTVMISELTSLESPRALRDRFRLIQSNIGEQRVADEIQDFTSYGSEKMVVVRNDAQDSFRLWCRSHHDEPRMATISPGNAYVFTFRPQKTKKSVYWCTIDYQQNFARFDVYNERVPHLCPTELENVFQYTVRQDGVYADGLKESDGNKIRALLKGHNKFILWEDFDDNVTDGLLLTGLVDGGMCSDLPEHFEDSTAAVTICNHHCIHLYEHLGCRGKVQTVQAGDGCIDVGLNGELHGALSAVQGC